MRMAGSRCVVLARTVGLLLMAAGLPALAAAAEPADPLPLKRIVLFTSGVGFFEHSGEIDGDKLVELKFNIEDVNDLLKSMILQDLGGGTINRVTIDSPEPITHTLKTFSIDLTRSPSLADLLRQLRGEKVQVSTPTATVGTIVGVEKHHQLAGKDQQQVVEVETLLLKTATGLRAIPMANVADVKLLDERLDKELQDALDVLAQAHATNKKTVALNFQGKGKRPVLVGYVQEAPVWKTSYRLALEEGKPALLQGWAIVENTTEQDWKGVKVALVSGRPVSFQMDLYQPLFADRPVVVPEMYAGLQPRVHEADLGGFQARASGAGGAFGGGGGFGGGGMGGFNGNNANSNQNPAVTSVVPVVGGHSPDEKPLDLTQGVASAAQGSAVGELFRYSIEAPVDLARQKTALLPIVNNPVKAEKLSLFNASVEPRHPMNAARLTNDTQLHLMQGPITVFDGGEYAGDAQIEDMSPGARRLVSYGLDLDVDVASHVSEEAIEAVIGSISHGELHIKKSLTRQRSYIIKNSSDKKKRILIEQPRDADWTVADSKEWGDVEETRSFLRLAIDAPAKKTTRVHTAEKRTVSESQVLAMAVSAPIVVERSGSFSDDVKKALAEIRARQLVIATVADRRASLTRRLRAIDEEQSRIRQNMAQLDRTTDLYHSYVKKLTDQEEELTKLRAALETATTEETKSREALDEFVQKLDVK
jgi:hypothetical protein